MGETTNEYSESPPAGDAACEPTAQERERLVLRLEEVAADANRSRAQLEAVFEAMQDGVVVFDMEGKVVLLNEAEARINGFASANEMKRDLAFFASIYELSEPNGQPIPVEQWPVSRILRGEPVCDWELRTRRSDTGQEWFLSFSGAPVYDETGRQILAVTITRDITERQRAEESLREREEICSAIFSQAADGIVLIDAETLRFVEFNDAACYGRGYTREEFAALRLTDVQASLTPQEVAERMSAMLRNGGGIFENQHRCKNGEIRDIRVSNRVVHIHGRQFMAGIWTDITERKQVETALRQSEALYRSLVDNVEVGIALVDANYTIVTVNPPYARVFGKSVDEFPGKKCYCEFENRDEACPHCPGTKAMATGRPEEAEVAGIRDDGSHSCVRIKAFPLFGPDGAATGFVQLVEDITQSKKAQELLEQAKEAAEAANRAKSAFLANISHEIRTPITAILGFSDLLMTPNLSRGEQDEFLEGIRRNGRTLLELIGDILDISRIEADRLTLQEADYPLRQLIDEVESAANAQAEKKGLSLVVEFRPPLPEIIHTDPTRLRQILVNLVGNAVKFTQRGEVRIAVGCLEESGQSTRLVFAVSDTGIGIAPDKIGALFQPFMQVDMSSSRPYGGAGLGLAVSKRLAHALGGDVEVASTLGQGSTFTLTINLDAKKRVDLPRTPQAALAAQESAEPDQPLRPRHGRLLLAEDDRDLQRIVRLMLRKMNLEVDIAEDGQTACEMAEQSQAEGRPYDLILMDIQMPQINGYEATRRLRRRGWQGRIIALTAHATVGDREKCLTAGCDDYIAKPVITAKGLRAFLAHHLRQNVLPARPVSGEGLSSC